MGRTVARRATKKARKRDPAKISGPCPSPSSRRWDARRCGGAMGRGVVRWAQDDGVNRRLRTAFSTIERRAGCRRVLRMTTVLRGCAGLTKKVQKRDPSPSSRRWDARRCGGAMGRTIARQAQDDGAITGVVSFLIERRAPPPWGTQDDGGVTRLRTAFSTFERRAGRRRVFRMTVKRSKAPDLVCSGWYGGQPPVLNSR